MLAPNALRDPGAISTVEDPEQICSPYPEGSVLLTSDGRIIKLNSVGSLLWELLYSQQDAGGVTEPNLLAFVSEKFETDQTSSHQNLLGNDLKHFLFALKNRRLISVSADQNGAQLFSAAKGTLWSGQLCRQVPCARANLGTTPVKNETDRKRFMTLRALSWLLIYSLLLRTGGFRAIRKIVERKGKQLIKLSDNNSERETCFQICTAVDRAQVYLLRQALCLQRSIVITRLLQDCGIDAETVIAAHLMPFKSHAWVEIDGEVVNDSPNVKRYYDVVVERLGHAR
jgi:hypothetical protein